MPIAKGGTVERSPTSQVEDLQVVAQDIRVAVQTVIEGKPEVIDEALVALFASGHLLIEDVPGVGKTMLAKALARSIAGTAQRIQFTPDLLPSDITGVSIFNSENRAFEFKPGGVFANVVIGDEINRASPKTQSALLEAMEEHQVTVDGITHPLPDPFMVVATQNPIEMEGTYPLPEAQRDRFMLRISMGYPVRASEIAMLDHHGGGDPLAELQPVTDVQTVARLAASIRRIYVHGAIKDYLVAVLDATRNSPDVRLGGSPLRDHQRDDDHASTRPAGIVSCLSLRGLTSELEVDEGRAALLADAASATASSTTGADQLATTGLATSQVVGAAATSPLGRVCEAIAATVRET